MSVSSRLLRSRSGRLLWMIAIGSAKNPARVARVDDLRSIRSVPTVVLVAVSHRRSVLGVWVAMTGRGTASRTRANARWKAPVAANNQG